MSSHTFFEKYKKMLYAAIAFSALRVKDITDDISCA